MNEETFNIRITKVFVCILFMISILMSLFGYQIASAFIASTNPAHIHVASDMQLPILLTLGYCGAVSLIYMLGQMYRFLKNLQKGNVFSHENVIILKCIERGCELGSMFTIGMGILYSPVLLAIAFMAVFMSLIIRVIRNAFYHATVMKDELDLTI